MKLIYTLFLLHSLLGIISAQNSAVPPRIKGNCNGTATGSNISVTIKCDSAESPAEAKKLAQQYAEILERIRRDKGSFEEVNRKLDAIESGVNSLRDSAAGRSLTSEQIALLRSQVENLDKSKLSFAYYTSDAEVAMFGAELQAALGLPTNYGNQIMGSSNPDVGVKLVISDEDASASRVPRICYVVDTFLANQHIAVSRSHSAMPSGSCYVLVGLKPPSEATH